MLGLIAEDEGGAGAIEDGAEMEAFAVEVIAEVFVSAGPTARLIEP